MPKLRGLCVMMDWKKKSLIMLAIVGMGIHGQMVFAADHTDHPLELSHEEYLNQAMTKKTGEKEFKIDSYDHIKWNDHETTSNYKGIINATGANTYTVLTKKLEMDSDALYGNAIRMDDPHPEGDTVINLGQKNNEIGDLDITCASRETFIGKVQLDGTDQKLNVYAGNFSFKMRPTTDEFWNYTALIAHGVGNTVNINASSKMDLEGDIGCAYVYSRYCTRPFENAQKNSIQINQDLPADATPALTIQGNIYSFNKMAGLSDKSPDSNNIIKINFDGQNSSFTGKVTDYYGDQNGSLVNGAIVSSRADASSTIDSLKNAETIAQYLKKHAAQQGTHLTFTKGASWRMTNDSKLVDLNAHSGALIDLRYSNISAPQSGKIGPHFQKLEVYHDFHGDGAVVQMNIQGNTEPDENKDNNNNSDRLVVYGTHDGTTLVDVSPLGEDISKAKGTVLAQVAREKGSFQANETEDALFWSKYDLDKVVTPNFTNWQIGDRKIIPKPTNTVSVSTLLSTVSASYDTWRNDADTLMKRMGELRLNGKEENGIWVRTKGTEFGRHGGNGVYTNRQHTYQIGYDHVTKQNEKETVYTGMAAQYGKGSLDFEHGTGTMKSSGLSAYQTHEGKSGHYLDLVYQYNRYTNDFHVKDSAGRAINGKYGNNAMALSAEYGKKNQLKHGWYVEPQSELTLGYMWGHDFTTSNRVQVTQKNMTALIGRLGFHIGREIHHKASFYLKASINHDFLGNYDIHMTDLVNKDTFHAHDDFGSSWFEYGVGCNVKFNKNSYLYFDLERAVGGEYKKNWDWNAGIRWNF